MPKKTSMMRLLERQHEPLTIAEIVADAITQCGSVDAAAKKLGVSVDTLHSWRRDLGISVRTVAEVAP